MGNLVGKTNTDTNRVLDRYPSGDLPSLVVYNFLFMGSSCVGKSRFIC